MKEELLNILKSYSFNYSNESELQTAIEQVFVLEKIAFIREAKLNAQDRIDFLVGDIGIEIKVGHSYSDVVRQMHRYAQSDRVAVLILVTTRLQHILPTSINEKELLTVSLALTHSL